MKEFSWTLLETEGHRDRGRYLEELQFFVEAATNSSGGGVAAPLEPVGLLACAWTMGYQAPKTTTYPSDLELSTVVTSLVLGKEIKVCYVRAHCALF